MPKPSRIFALNMGSQTVTLAEFQATSSGGLVLADYRMEELPVESIDGGGRERMLQAAIQGMMTDMGHKSLRVNYAVSGQSVFTRFVRLPSVDPEKVEQIIQFEAQQNVPFPIQEVVWDYQLVGGGNSGQVEVVLVAIKSDLLESINDSVINAGLSVHVVDVAPMAIYNAFRYNYGSTSGCSLIIDIGSKTTNLIFCEPGKVFSRSIPIGGVTITSAIAKEIGMSMGAAETFKKEECFVSLGGAYADPENEQVAHASKLARNTLTRLHNDVNRSISFYKAQQHGSQPNRVFLSGGSVNMPYMSEFFSEKLQMPVEYLNPLRNVAVGSRVDTEKVATQAHMLGEVVGLGLRGIADCPMELNLSPASVVQEQKLAAKKPFLVAAAICLLLSLGAWWGYLQKATEVKGQVLEKLKERVTQLQGYENSIKKVSKEIETLQKTSQPFKQIVNDRQFWAATLNELNAKLPERFIWLTEIEPLSISGASINPVVPGGADNTRRPTGRPAVSPGSQTSPAGPPQINALRLKGLYLENPRNATIVDNFVAALSESATFGDIKVVSRTTPTGSDWAYPFELQVQLKSPIAAP